MTSWTRSTSIERVIQCPFDDTASTPSTPPQPAASTTRVEDAGRHHTRPESPKCNGLRWRQRIAAHVSPQARLLAEYCSASHANGADSGGSVELESPFLAACASGHAVATPSATQVPCSLYSGIAVQKGVKKGVFRRR